MTEAPKRRVGIVGYGNTGKYLVEQLLKNPRISNTHELAFIWNRDFTKVSSSTFIPKELQLQDLSDFRSKKPDLIVEVAHPSITQKYGKDFLDFCDYMIGSPTALADIETEKIVRSASLSHGVYIPVGAFWGAEDIYKMAIDGSLRGLTVTMKKHPKSLKVADSLKQKILNGETDKENIIYSGPVRELCNLAPNNVNTMACAALAGLGFDKTHAVLISDERLKTHEIEICVSGPESDIGKFTVRVVRSNPATVGSVTGTATFASFLSSLINAGGRGNGFHFC
eukprot:TRINITY_DN14053_c0_g1_i1.p1 TRINITY_DN14053_c0_g1~~TRINITY_DN14053_c0_g1_i1.p1  ORF type:complete len:282 (-),score=45.24 TRINITY_DN14053_c0_g1_i1:82-927(-)